MDAERLFEVRCPQLVKAKGSDEKVKCNHLCVKVFPGSSGEIKCRHCGLTFNFYVDSQAKSLISVKAKPIK